MKHEIESYLQGFKAGIEIDVKGLLDCLQEKHQMTLRAPSDMHFSDNRRTFYLSNGITNIDISFESIPRTQMVDFKTFESGGYGYNLRPTFSYKLSSYTISEV